MIKHYLKIGIRNLTKYRIQSIISIIGLAIGFMFFTVGYHWFNYETSYDSFYPESKQTYKIYTINKQTGKISPEVPSILSATMNADFPEVKYAADFYNFGGTYSCEGKSIGRPNFKCVNEYFTKVFPRHIIAGNKENPIPTNSNLASTNLMVTERFALKYWRTPEEAIGKILTDQYNFATTITAVIDNPPTNSVFQEEGYFAIPMEKNNYTKRSLQEYWTNSWDNIYVCLHKNIHSKTFAKKLRTYAIDNNLNPDLYIEMVPLSEARYKLGSEISFNINYIQTFAICGLLLLFCALFNFINLQVNRFFERSREFKLRSSLGAVKKNIFLQMTIEISIQVILVLLISISLVEICLPRIEQLLETVIHKRELFIELVLIICAGWLFLIAVILLFISRFVYRLSNAVKTGKEVYISGREWIRKLNIGVQLIICIGFMFSALVLFQQISMMKNKPLGFDKNNLIQIKISDQVYSLFVDEVKKIPNITSVIRGGNFHLSHEREYTENDVDWDNKNPNTANEIQPVRVGINFVQEMGIQLLKGRYLQESDLQEDKTTMVTCKKILINEQMAKLTGFDNPIGKMINRAPMLAGQKGRIHYEIVGVVKDFHELSLRNPVSPAIIGYCEWLDNYMYLRTKPGTEKETLKSVKELINRISPIGFELSEAMTVNDQLDMLTRTENASLRLFTLLATLCILISIFGIYSISTSNMQQRKKEIAIRKVMGASSIEIIQMFLKKYTAIALAANLIALPAAHVFAGQWLEQYPFRIYLQPWMFMLVIIISIALVILTVLGQVIKAVNNNPADVVKSD